MKLKGEIMVVVVLLIIFVVILVASFVVGLITDKRMTNNKEMWFNSHTEEERKLVEDYSTFVKTNKVKRNEKK